MLNGLAPIIIFNFKKLLPQFTLPVGIPLIAEAGSTVPLIPIPIYLKEEITGLYIKQQNKNVDIETKVQTLTDGTAPKVLQNGLNSTVTINMVSNKNSIGLGIMSALIDLIFEKVTSEEYSISYFNGAVTVFGGLLEGYSVSENESNDLYNVSLQISRSNGGSTTEKVADNSVGKVPGPTLRTQ